MITDKAIMKKFCSLLLWALMMFCTHLYAGENKAVGFGFEVGINKELPKNFDIGLFTELHTCQTFTALEHYCIILHTGYTPVSWLHVEIGYQFMDINNAEDRADLPLGWVKMHRAFGGLEGTYEIKGFSVSLRERYDFTSNPGTHDMRSRLALGYEFQKVPLGIGLSYEIINDLQHKFKPLQMFYRIGIEYTVKEQHTLELGVGFNGYDFQEEERGHLIELGYEFSF